MNLRLRRINITEQIRGESMKKGILKDVGVITVSRFAGSLISFVNIALLSRFRTLSEFGTYSEMLLTASLVIAICDLGLPYAVTYFGSRAETEEGRRHFFSVFYTLDTVISIFIGIVMVLAIPLMEWYFDNPNISKYWYFLMLYPWVRIIDATIDNVLVILKKSVLIAAYRITYGILVFLVILTIQQLGLGFDEYVMAYTGLLVILMAAAYFLVSKNLGGIRPRFDSQTFKSIMKYAIPIGLASAVGMINIEFDKFIIGHYCSEDEMAIYANASKALPVSLIAGSISMVLMPTIIRKVSEGKDNEAAKMWGNAIVVSLDILMTIVFALLVFAPEVVEFIYSDKYLDGTNVFRIYCTAYLLECTYWGTMLNAKGKTKYILYGSIISCTINIILDLVLFNVFGMKGPAIATVISQGCLVVFQFLMSKKLLNVKSIVNLNNLSEIAARNIIIAAVCYILKTVLVNNTGINNIVIAFAVGALWMLFYILMYGKSVLKKINLLSAENKNEQAD